MLLVCLVGLLSGVVAGLARPDGDAAAHAVLEEVVPADDDVVDRPPNEVTLRFSERVSLAGGNARVLNDAGDVVSIEAGVTDTVVSIALPEELDEGTYAVTWRVISADSHPVAGTSVFHVGAPSADSDQLRTGLANGSSDEAGTLLPVLTTVVIAVAYGAVLIAAGLWWFVRGVARISTDTASGARCRAIVVAVAAVGLLATLISLPLRIARLSGGWWGLHDGELVREAITGPIGAAVVVSAIGLILVVAGRWTAVAAVGTVIGVGAYALEGHTRTKDPEWLMLGLDVLHLVATAAWLGGLVGVLVVLRTVAPADRAVPAVVRFSKLAALLIVLVSGAGTAMSVIVLPDVSALWDTGYGLTLVAKVAMVGGALLLGARNRRLVGAGGEAGRNTLARIVRFEVVILLAVVAATAVLVDRSPTSASGSSASPNEVATSGPFGAEVTLSRAAGTATIGVTPARVGSNELTFALTTPDGAPLRPVDVPTVELRERSQDVGPLRPAVHDLGDGEYHVFADIPVAGRWEIVVRVRVDDFTSATADVTVAIPDG